LDFLLDLMDPGKIRLSDLGKITDVFPDFLPNLAGGEFAQGSLGRQNLNLRRP